MKKLKAFLMYLFGMGDLLAESKKQTALLEKIYQECKRNSDLVQAYNRTYHVK